MNAFPSQFTLRDGLLVDGTGAPPRPADVTVADGWIEEVSDGKRQTAGPVFDLDGLALSPGFIDLHTHCDFTLPNYPRAPSMASQGVTTLVVGNCGHSPFPLGDKGPEPLREHSAFLAKNLAWQWTDTEGYLQFLDRLPLSCDVAALVGHGAVRVSVMDFAERPPTRGELAAMKREVANAMQAGVFGLSTGLIYPPGSYAAEAELVELAAVVRRYGGFYATHLRNEGPSLLDAVEEAIGVAAKSRVPLQLSHHKALGKANWGRVQQSLARVDEARAEGLDILLDQYPYSASSTTLAALLPSWAMAGGDSRLRELLDDPRRRAKVRDEIVNGPQHGTRQREFEPETVVIASLPGPAPTGHIGRSLQDLAEARRQTAVDVALDLICDYGTAIEVVIFAIGEQDLHHVMQHPGVAIASDGWTLHPEEGGIPHPRSYGTFARVLGNYVRTENVLTLQQAVAKMTSLPARRLGFDRKGLICPGYQADLVVFDPTQIRDRATYEDPHQTCTGVHDVFVSGVPVIRDGQDTGLAPGRLLRRNSTHIRH